MLHLHQFTFNPFQENTYVIYNDDQQCWIIDPGMNNEIEQQELVSFINEKQLAPQAIINTHAHIDHILGVQFLKDKYQIPFALHAAEMPILQNAAGSAMMFGMSWKTTPTVDYFLDCDKEFALANDKVRLHFVPGHSPGSVVFELVDYKMAIAGDTLFAGSIGRTDLPGGHHETLLKAIQNTLFQLPDDTEIFPGHGPSTTIGQEKKINPFF